MAAVTADVTAALIAGAATLGAASIGTLGAALTAARASRASAAIGSRVEARLDELCGQVTGLDRRLDGVELVQAACTARTTPMIHRGPTPEAGT